MKNYQFEKGWDKLLVPIENYIEAYNKVNQIKLIITQAKEKFGTLRVYTNFSTNELIELIRVAEINSSKFCEVCGTDKDVSTGGRTYIRTLCNDCRKKDEEKIK